MKVPNFTSWNLFVNKAEGHERLVMNVSPKLAALKITRYLAVTHFSMAFVGQIGPF